MSTPIDTFPLQRARVQTASVWPTDDTGWTTQSTLIALSADDNFCNDLGQATLVRRIGDGFDPGAVVAFSRAPFSLDILGQYVRISLLEDDLSWTPMWWGKIRERTFSNAAGAAMSEEQYSCIGLGFILDQFTPRHGYAETYDALTSRAVDWLPFNERPHGDRSVDNYGIGDKEVHIHADSGFPLPYTAKDVARLILASVKDQCPDGPEWFLGGQAGDLSEPTPDPGNQGALIFSENWKELKGSALEMLTRIINPRRGLGFHITVDADHHAVIEVSSSLETAVTVDGETIPAAEDPIEEIDLSDNIAITDVTVSENVEATYDLVGIESTPEWWALTLGFKNDGTGQLVKGWNSSDETAWQDAVDAGDIQKIEHGKLNNVWRRFKLATTWTGETYNTPASSRWTFGRATDNTDLNGSGGETGEFIAGDRIPHPNNLRFTRMLPLYENENWDTVTIGGVDKTLPFMAPMIFSVDGSEWKTLAAFCGNRDMRIDPEQDAGAFTVGHGFDDAVRIKAMCEDEGRDLVVTIGIHHPMPVRVSWRRDPGDQPTEQMRQIIIPQAKGRRWILAADTVVRLEDDLGKTRGSQLEILEEIADLNQVLAVALPWYTRPMVTLRWKERGALNVDSAVQPGRLIRDATVGYIGGTATIADVLTTITKRSWDFTEQGYGTSYSTARIIHDWHAVT